MYSGLTVPPSLLALADEVMNNDPFLLHCMSPLLAETADPRRVRSSVRVLGCSSRRIFARCETLLVLTRTAVIGGQNLLCCTTQFL